MRNRVGPVRSSIAEPTWKHVCKFQNDDAASETPGTSMPSVESRFAAQLRANISELSVFRRAETAGASHEECRDVLADITRSSVGSNDNDGELFGIAPYRRGYRKKISRTRDTHISDNREIRVSQHGAVYY